MHWKVCLVVAAVVLAFSSIGSSQGSLDITIYVGGGFAAHLGISTPVTGGEFRRENRSNASVWVNDLYEIRVTQNLRKGVSYLRLHMESISRSSLPVQGISLRVLVPSNGIDGFWTPSGRLSNDALISAEAGKPFTTYSAANYGIPYIAAATASGDNSLAMGLLEQDLPVEIRATPVRNNFTELSLSAELSVSGSTLDQQFFVSSDGSYGWFDIAETYADWVDAGTKYSAFPISSRAYEPVYDTWYWSQDEVDERLYLETAEAASEAGLGTFLADSGWEAPAGEYSKWLLGRTGDYTPPPEKFTDLAETFDALRSQFHLQVQLWLQPFAVGRASTRYRQTRAMHIEIPRTASSAALAPFSLPLTAGALEDVNLCPRVSSTHQYLKDLFSEMSTTYHPEAYWLDFIDGMPTQCIAPHQHSFKSFGAGLREALNTIRSTIQSLEQNPVIQFRAQYANLNNKPFANVWQPFDSPNNFDRMRLDTLRLRAFSKGVVFASDQLYWPSDADDATVSRFVMTAVMSGVPSIGANLVDSRPSSVEIMKNWMGFYRKYKKDLTAGQFRPFGPFRAPNHKIQSDDRLFAYIRSNNRVALSGGAKKEIFLLNASDRRRVSAAIPVLPEGMYEVQAFNRYVRPEGAVMNLVPNLQNVLDINAVVERGGFLVLTRRN